MKRGWKAVARTCALAVAAGALPLVAGHTLAQSSGAPPPLPAAPAAKPATQKPAAPRSSIQITPAERQAIDAAQASAGKPVRVEDALAPTAEDIKPRTADDRSTTRIEQTHVSNRVSEVIVTPAGQSRSYVMNNREGQQPLGTTQMSPGGLSVPMFFRFEFGRTTPPPATNPPSPPAPSPSR
jgi:hypothetical protein